jgi:hypothetical protein
MLYRYIRSRRPAVYFTGPDGTVYRVLDAATRGGTLYCTNPPEPNASTRLFNVRKGGPHRFTPIHPDRREPTPEHIAADFAVSHRGGTGWPTAPFWGRLPDSDAAALRGEIEDQR